MAGKVQGKPPKLLDRVRHKLRAMHYAYSTEKAYCQWITRFILFHNKQHPSNMGKQEVEAFLTHLAVQEHVAASTQNQALSAILFLYQKVLEVKLEWLDNVVIKTYARRRFIHMSCIRMGLPSSVRPMRFLESRSGESRHER